jgi:hypothetical protein
MKTLSPTGRVRSAGNVRGWTALIAIATIGCLPLFSSLADQPHHNNKGGSNKAPGSHQGGSHGGSVSKAAAGHQGGNHAVSASKSASTHQGTHHASASKTTVSQHSVVSHPSSTSHRASTKTATSHQAASHRSIASRTEHTRVTSSQARNISPELRHGASSNTRASLYERNHTSREAHNRQAALTQERNNTRAPGHRANLPARINTASRATAFNHSLTASSAKGLMNRRLTEVTNRQWSTHGAVFSTRSDPQRGYWFQHGGYYWRCNFWGAHSYCDRLIVLGYPAGLCWAWYDDICWGNIIVGMPLDLVNYYYPTPVTTEDTDYDGEPATVYYYATDNGQYRQVTVVDGDVVDVEIVDHIA